MDRSRPSSVEGQQWSYIRYGVTEDTWIKSNVVWLVSNTQSLAVALRTYWKEGKGGSWESLQETKLDKTMV